MEHKSEDTNMQPHVFFMYYFRMKFKYLSDDGKHNLYQIISVTKLDLREN